MSSLTLFYLLILIITYTKAEFYKKIQCKSFDRDLVRFDICAVGKLKNIDSLDIGFMLFKEVNKPLYLQITASRKMRENYFQEFFRTNLIEYCDLMNGLKTNFFVASLVNDIKKTAPAFIHPCPFEGFINGSNLIVDSKKINNFWIKGIFKLEFTFYKKNKRPLAMARIDINNGDNGLIARIPDMWLKNNN